MAVSTGSYLRTFYGATRGMGEKIISSDFTFEIEGFEHLYLLCKQAPWPELSPQGEIEVATPLGAALWQPQQIRVQQQGAITLMETTAGHVEQAMIELLTTGAYFDAKIYEGTPQKFLRAKTLRDCFMQVENPDRDWENRSQVLTFSGTLFFHYFGENIQGNSKDY